MPGESIMLLRPIASRMFEIVVPDCTSFAGSGCTSNSGTCPPCTTTDETPAWRLSRGFRSYVDISHKLVCGILSDVMLYPIIGKAAKVSRLAVIFAVGGSVD